MNQKKSEYIDWKEHPTLNNVTKQCINYYENTYSFDTYLDDRSKKDNKFVNPLLPEDAEEKDQNNEDGEDSDYSMSGEEEEGVAHQQRKETRAWERQTAEELYRRTREEIEQRYFVL